MKNFKRIFGFSLLMAIVSSFVVSCGRSQYQEQKYYGFLEELARVVNDTQYWSHLTNKYETREGSDYKADALKAYLDKSNKDFALVGFKVIDKKGGDVKKGTTFKQLKKRFQYKKL